MKEGEGLPNGARRRSGGGHGTFWRRSKRTGGKFRGAEKKYGGVWGDIGYFLGWVPDGGGEDGKTD